MGRKKVVAANGNLLKQFSSTRVALLWELPELQRGTMWKWQHASDARKNCQAQRWKMEESEGEKLKR
jgi:hypothetical protein